MKDKDLIHMPLGAVEKELKKYRSQILKQGKVNSAVVKQMNKLGKVSGKIPAKSIFSSLQSNGTLGYKNAIGTFRKRTSIEGNYSQINSAVRTFRQLTRRILGDHDENIKVANILMRNGWVTSEFIYNDILKMNYHKSEEEVLRYIESFYSLIIIKDFLEYLDLVIDGFQELGMNEGYRLQLVRIRKAIYSDFTNYDLFMNDLFSIAEYVCDFQLGLLSNNDYINKTSIKASRRKYADENGQLTAIDLLSFFTVLRDWWGKANFKKGLAHTEFNRNTVEHGRFDPRRYRKIDFVKILVFIFNAMMSPALRND